VRTHKDQITIYYDFINFNSDDSEVSAARMYGSFTFSPKVTSKPSIPFARALVPRWSQRNLPRSARAVEALKDTLEPKNWVFTENRTIFVR
jgi:hypothetical protein